MIKAVFMDIDDTLLSFSGYVKQTMKEGFKEFGLPEYNDSMYPIFKRINTGLWKQIENGEITFDELRAVRWNKIFGELGIDFDGQIFEPYFRKKLFDSAIVEVGARELLDYLNDKYILCVASNGPYDQQINRLKAGGLYDYFEHFFISEKIGAQKPSKEFFDYCIQELRDAGLENILPEEIMIIGDSISADISGGKQYGMKTCLYNSDAVLPEGDIHPDYVVKTLAEIMQIL